MSIVPTNRDPGGRLGAAGRRRRGCGRVRRARARPRARVAGRGRLQLDRRLRQGRRQLRQGHALGRRPVLPRPRRGRLPELRRHARRVRRALAGGLRRAPDRPARQRVRRRTWTRRRRSSSASSRTPTTRATRTATAPTGPCWSRDADNHQGYSTGPLADTVADAPNAPGVEVASSATWVGDNQTTTDHSYAGGGYDLEVKIPMADLPAAVDPAHIGLNITPYDNDNTAAGGTGTLRHIDQSTRLAWSAFNSVQSDPWIWGHATRRGLHAAGRPPDDARGAERLEPQPQRGRVAADDRPVRAQRSADRRAPAGAGQRPHHGRQRRADRSRAPSST